MNAKDRKKDAVLHAILSVAGTKRKQPTRYQKKNAKIYLRRKKAKFI